MKKTLSLSLLISALATGAVAADYKPALIYDLGGKFDKSFNQSANVGAEHFQKETGVKYRGYELQKDTEREQYMRKFASKGYSPIVMPGFSQAAALKVVSKDFPKVNFVIVDGVVEEPNVRSVLFREQEGSFLVGALAAMKSKTNTLGFVGGYDIDLINAFGCGYVQGAKYINKDIKVIQSFIGGPDGNGWANQDDGRTIATVQIKDGADVIYAAAGGAGMGTYQAAKDAGVYAIGVDSNQNYLNGKDHLNSKTMLTSMVKRVDIAVDKAFKDGMKPDFKTGFESLGLKENAVTWAYDEYNKDLITAEEKAKMDQIEKDIIEGKIKVHDFRSTKSCPVK